MCSSKRTVHPTWVEFECGRARLLDFKLILFLRSSRNNVSAEPVDHFHQLPNWKIENVFCACARREWKGAEHIDLLSASPKVSLFECSWACRLHFENNQIEKRNTFLVHEWELFIFWLGPGRCVQIILGITFRVGFAHSGFAWIAGYSHEYIKSFIGSSSEP